MAFDKNKYDNEYKKNNYIQKIVRIKPDFWLKIEDYLNYNGIGINEFFNSAAKYILDEKIDLKGYK